MKPSEQIRLSWGANKFISSPSPRAYFWAIMIALSSLAASIFFAFWIEIDVTVVGRGEVVYDQEIRSVQAKKTGIVDKVLVKNNQTVEKDSPIAILRTGSLTVESINLLTKEVEQFKNNFINSIRSEHQLETLVSKTKEEPSVRDALLELASQYKSYMIGLHYYSFDLKKQQEPQLRQLKKLKMKQSRMLASNKQKYLSDYIEQTESEISRIESSLSETQTDAKRKVSDSKQEVISLSEKVVARLQSSMEARILRSPVSGRITRLDIQVNKQISEGDQVVTIVPSSSKLLTKINLESRYVPKIKTGQKVKIRMDAYPFEVYGVFEGEVLDIEQSRNDKGMGQFMIKTSLFRPTGLSDEAANKIQVTDGLQFDGKIIIDRRTLASLGWEKVRGLSNRW